MSFAIRGILEGYYGRPWSWPERYSMLDFAAERGFNLYFYCPKNDPLHRNRWREPYLPEEMDRFAALAARCREHGIDFVFGLSPLEFHYSDPADLEAVLVKLRAVQARGVRSFSLLLDDMPDRFRHPDDEERFGSLAAAQAWLNNTVLARLRESGSLGTMSFCPTEYHGRGESSYLRELGEKLDSAVDVFWTGSHVCSPALTVENARAASASLRRPVVFWDNYPVNDLEMRFDAHLGPLTGRAPALAGVARGLVAAAGSNSESSKVALHTVADYLSDPAGYLPEAAWRDALLAVAGSAAEADAVGTLADLARRSPLNPGTQYANHLLGTLDRFWAAWGGVPASSGPDLPGLPPGHGRAMAASAPDRRAALARLQGDLAPLRAAAARLLAPMANARLQQELRPWSEKLSGWLRVVDAALAVLAAALHDPRDPALSLLREAALDQLLLTRENFHWVAGDMLDQFARRCFWAAEELGSTPRGG